MTTASADVPLKGLTYLIEALAKIRTEREDAHLVVIGQPRHKSAVPAQIERLGLTDAVEFVSGVTDERIVELYAEAEIAVVPSLYEGFSLPAIEAMACGVPLVTTTGGALPEVVGPSRRERDDRADRRRRRARRSRSSRCSNDAEHAGRSSARAAGAACSTGSPGARPPKAPPSSTTSSSRRTRAGGSTPGCAELLTVDFDRLGLVRGERLLDLGVGRRPSRVRGDAPRRARHRARLLRRRPQGRRRGRGRDARSAARSTDRRSGPASSTATRSTCRSPTTASTASIVSEVLEHIWDDERALAEIVRVLRPGGRVAATVPTRWPERVSWAINDRLPRHARRPRPHLPPARARAEARARRLLPARLAPRARVPLAVLVAEVRVRARQHRSRAGEALPRLPLPSDRAQPALGARHRTGAEPGARQEPRRLRREGAAVDGANGGSAALPERSDSPKSPASSPRAAGRADRRRDRVGAAARRQHPVGPRRPHRPVEPRRGRDGARRRRPLRRGRARVRVAARACSTLDGSWHAYYAGRRREGAHARHQRHLLRRERRVAPLPLRPATPASSRSCSRSSSARSTSRSTTSTRPARSSGTPIPTRVDGKGALLTGSSSIYSSLRCAIAAAERLGRERPDWELSLGSLAIAIAHRPERFLDKERWAMDWYYPILGGVLRGHAAEARVASKWDTFVVAGSRRALRLGSAVDHRGRDVRARDGARRDRAARPGATSCSRGCSSCATTTAATGPA